MLFSNVIKHIKTQNLTYLSLYTLHVACFSIHPIKIFCFLALILSDKHSRSQKFYMTLQLLEYIIPLYAINL